VRLVIVTAVGLLASAAIVWGFVCGCHRPARVVAWRALALGGGLGSLVLALSPWVDAGAERTFAAHMTQHLILITVAAPLLVAADAVAAVVAGLPLALRRPIAWFHREARGAGLAATGPWPRLVVHVAIVFAWHTPPLFDAALSNPSFHAFEHLTFLATALWFWEPLLTRRGVRRAGEVVGIAYVTLAGVAWSTLGALLTFSSQPWYATYVRIEGAVAAVRDQQLAGLLMWLPPGVLSLAVAFVLFWRLLERLEPTVAGRSLRGTLVGGRHG
jgi:putative membrane protein